jgi:hypothetical protein
MPTQYQYLTPEDRTRIIAEVRTRLPAPEEKLRAAECEQFRLEVEVELGLRGADSVPAYEAPNTDKEEAAQVVLDRIATTGELSVEPAALNPKAL